MWSGSAIRGVAGRASIGSDRLRGFVRFFNLGLGVTLEKSIDYPREPYCTCMDDEDVL